MFSLKRDPYPPSAFYFRVVFISLNPLDNADSSFRDVSGLSYSMDTIEVAEGGLNEYTHRLPTVGKRSNLVLKRGVVSMLSLLVLWCKDTLENDLSIPVHTKTLQIHLLDADENPVRMWEVTDAWPVRWEVEEFNSSKNEVAIETIELSYNKINRIL